jgi:hypothetical protein
MADRYTQYPIDEFDLPTRARNALVRAGITMPEELVARSDAELLALRGLGPTGLAQVQERLAAWERERGSEEIAPVEVPEAPEALEDEQAHEPLTLLPGRQVVHATWIPGSPASLFVWGEKNPQAPAGHSPRSEVSNPQYSTPIHPFQIPPAAVRDILPGLILEAAEDVRALARLPANERGHRVGY